MFGEKANATSHLACAHRLTKQESAATGWLDQAKQHLDRSAFAGAIRAKKPEGLSATDLEGQIADGSTSSVGLPKLQRIDGKSCHARSGSLYCNCEVRLIAMVSSPVPFRAKTIPLSTHMSEK